MCPSDVQYGRKNLFAPESGLCCGCVSKIPVSNICSPHELDPPNPPLQLVQPLLPAGPLHALLQRAAHVFS